MKDLAWPHGRLSAEWRLLSLRKAILYAGPFQVAPVYMNLVIIAKTTANLSVTQMILQMDLKTKAF